MGGRVGAIGRATGVMVCVGARVDELGACGTGEALAPGMTLGMDVDFSFTATATSMGAGGGLHKVG